MRFAFRAMTEGDARAVAGWRYPGEYAFYDADQDPRDLAELLDPARWGREYFAVDGDGELAGFFVVKRRDGAKEIGLGLRPDLTGRGLGLAFVEAGLRFAAPGPFVLHVAAFNRRATAVYERAGFRETERYEHFTNGALHPFVRMDRPA